jgi:hypothetical protein
MFDDLDLSGVLSQLKRADDALAEFVAPWWAGAVLAVAWMEKGPRLFRLTEMPAEAGYWLFGTADDTATPIRPAEDAEVRKYLGLLPKATVILLAEELAYPGSFAEKLAGITGSRPIHFAPETPLVSVQARFDGVNLLYDGATAEKTDDPFGGLLSESSIFAPGELLDTPGDGAGGADTALQELQAHPEQAVEARLNAVLEPAGATLVSWTPADGGVSVTWKCDFDEWTAALSVAGSPITSGICLPGSRGFNPGRLTRMLLDHLLDTWQG